MIVKAIDTHKILFGESLIAIIDKYIPRLEEKNLVAITSKIVSSCEQLMVIKKNISSQKISLIKQEADRTFIHSETQNFILTLKNHRLIPNAGIDESNCNGHYLLLPRNPMGTAKKLWHYLKKKHKLKYLGIIITDSNITPLRSGTHGIAIGWCGFSPLHSYIGKKDLFDRTMEVTKINLIDSLATTATLVMGDGNEQKPIAILENLPPTVKFKTTPPSPNEVAMVTIDPKQDLFRPIMKI